MSENIPITSSVLIWARQRSGYSIEEMSKSFKKYGDWEKGDSFPTYKQLEAISDKFKCPIALFFFPNPPELEPIEKSFRTLPETESEFMPRSVRLLLRKAKAMQLNLIELNEGKNPAKKLMIKELELNIQRPIEKIASEIRSYLGVSLEEQSSWKNELEALDKWRNILTYHGVFVFKDPFRDNNYSGFCLYDNEFPIIYVNNSNSASRQIFTYFHELAHLLLRTSGIDKVRDNYVEFLDRDEKRIEVFANKIASTFLVPDSDFSMSAEGLEINNQNIYKLAKRYNVSREVILRKFFDHGVITTSFYNSKVSEWAAQQKTKGKGGDYYLNQFTYLGKAYINLALDKYKQNKIDSVQVSDYLNIQPKLLEKFEDKYNSLGSKSDA